VITDGNEFGRRYLNARMRRIDLLCKLLGPLVISLINGASTIIAIQIVLGMNVFSVLIEYLCIAKVYHPPATNYTCSCTNDQRCIIWYRHYSVSPQMSH
jgi:solute carrier family 40 (iron-regulated transporter), member 1